MIRKPSILKIATLLCLGLALSRSAFAHLGPPFPILVDQPIPGYSVTVLANPDVGQAVFIVVLEPVKSAAAVLVSNVDVWVQPVTGRLPKAVFPAERQSAGSRVQFLATPDIDAAEMWKVGVDIHLADGTDHSLATQVQATPPGIGPWGVLFFFFPFLLFGGLWALAFRRRARARALKSRRTQSLSSATNSNSAESTTASRDGQKANRA